jgi:predicted flap endonuclease-1-like 5' DNA nuclease
MNETAATSAPGASLIPDGTGVITTMHFAIIGVLAVLALVAIVYGMRQKRRRRQADRVVAAHNEAVEAAPAEPASIAALPPVEPTAAPEPVADSIPAPAPLDDEPIAAAAPLAASPASEAAVAPASATSYADAPVTMLKGLGPKVAARLGESGITTVRHLAALDDHEAARLDAQLGSFAGRMSRDRWLEQARFLAAGDKAGFEAVFGRL